VLLSEQLEDTTQQITDKMGNLSKQLDKSTEQICVEIGQSTAQIITQMGGKVDQMGGKVDQSTAQVCEKIDEAVLPIHQELARFHSWAKLLVVGVWAVVASLIASLIFKACGGG